jgi:hypothetical protein
MHVLNLTRSTVHPRVRCRLSGRLSGVALVVAFVVALFGPVSAQAQETASSSQSHSLGVNLQFPDDGVIADEQLCVALYASTSPDRSQPPLLSRCLDPGGDAVSFEGLRPGDYSVLLPGPGTELEQERYQGQLVATSIPDDPQIEAFGIDVDVGLAPEFAGTTGRVQVSVFGCPAGTNAGDDKANWATECQALAGGVPLTLSGTGSINDAAFRAVTGLSGNQSGRVEFADLPAGAYELEGDLPENVSNTPALFVESSIDGSLGAVDPDETLALRPTETVAVDVYLVLDSDSGTTDLIGLSDPQITGAVAAE